MLIEHAYLEALIYVCIYRINLHTNLRHDLRHETSIKKFEMTIK